MKDNLKSHAIFRSVRWIGVVSTTVAGWLTLETARADLVGELFTPELLDAQLAVPLNAQALDHDTSTNLPLWSGFWTDLIDTEKVEETGEGVYVAVLDSGLVPEAPFFFSQADIAWHLGAGFTQDLSWDPVAGEVVAGPLRSDRGYVTGLASGHGTHIASTVVGFNLFNDAWIDGVAPHATIIPVLVIDGWQVDIPMSDGSVERLELEGGTDAMVAAGILYVADLSDSLDGPVVINMSLGGPSPSPEIEAAVNYATGKGVIVVAAAGNSGSDGMDYPGGLPQVISAGAAGWASMFDSGWLSDAPERLNLRDSLGNASHLYLPNYSSRPNRELNQKYQDLDLSAPGEFVVGPFKPGFTDELGYYFLSGTSVASPHVAGMAALLLESNPQLNQSDMEFILERAASVQPLPASDAWVSFPFIPEGGFSASWDGGDYGHGFLQADAAVFSAAVAR